MERSRTIPDVDPTYPLGFPLAESAWTEWDVATLLEESGEKDRSLALRELTARANAGAKRTEPWHAGELMALAILVDVQRYIIDYYTQKQVPDALEATLEKLDSRHPVPMSGPAASAFNAVFPAETFLSRIEAAREMALVRLLGDNPAVGAYQELFDDAELRVRAVFPALVDQLETAFEEMPQVTGIELTLFELLRAPALAAPGSIALQLEFILLHFRALLPDWLLAELLKTQGVLREETLARGGGPGPVEALRFDDVIYEDDGENFTEDQDWMTNVVVCAKLTHVWLDQLSKRYGHHIQRLNEIPDEELDRLAGWGFNALWLIGPWQRSAASRVIKQRMGNSEALASAYSTFDYQVADDLGGEDAWSSLRERCQQRGLRLATDMVPNHTGIDSRWIMEHPDRFLQLTAPPYPGYSFNGPDLSGRSEVGLFLEDGYWDRSDAAVVFKRVDNNTGGVRYIYHGNDGTHMPWNDTAQLNYLDPGLREAIIQTILDVAKRASIIRFDAAMTLAKRHIRRLWYPAQGEGGAIPSRAERGLAEAAFNKYMPKEFWREVVERIQAEAPDTLLIAEAFWLMEGYFVRTLGMHRVYNSAFMHMLRDEDNSKLRASIKNVLAYSPPILQRFVNFMNNPDEDTAVAQFGKDDKYFGCALLLTTLPGLPMFGHGQIQGFSEKYGMEYARAYRDEAVDEALVARHEREIFPLMRRRYLFSQADSFAFYDLRAVDGSVQESVYAYSNRVGGERALVFYNNAYVHASGWVRTAAPTRFPGVDEPMERTLTQALGLMTGEGRLVAMRELRNGLEFLRWANDLADGMYVELGAYQAQVFVDIREIEADENWTALMERVAGRGVPDLQAAFNDVKYEPLRQAFADFIEATADGDEDSTGHLKRFAELASEPPEKLIEAVETLPSEVPLAKVIALMDVLEAPDRAQWALGRVAGAALGQPDLEELVPVLVGEAARGGNLVETCEAARGFLQVNPYEGVDWFNGERMASFIDGLALAIEARQGESAATVEKLLSAAEASEYDFAKFLSALE